MPDSRLQLTRNIFTNFSTVGDLRLDGVHECYTLEDTCRARGVKVYGETAIPPGTYEIVLRESPRLGNRYGCDRLPTLLDVPMFEGILIHPFNTPEQTLGCIGPGTSYGPDRINESRKAFDALMVKIQDMLSNGRLWITITGGK